MHMNWCQSNPAVNRSVQTVFKDSIQTKPVSEYDTFTCDMKGVLTELVNDVIAEEKK